MSGNGTVVFGNAGGCWANILQLVNSGTTLTIGSGITVQGQNGVIGSGSGYCAGGPANVAVINQGTISADVSGGTISIQANSFQNNGIIWAAGGTIALPSSNFQNTGTLQASNGGVLNVPQMPSTVGNIIALAGGTVRLLNSVYFNGANLLSSQPGGTVTISGSLLGDTKNLGQFTPLGTLVLDGTNTASSPQLVEVMGQDLGTSPLGFIHNFNYGTLILSNNTYVQLVNQYQNSGSSSPEALYVNSLVVLAGTTLNMNGLHVYARAALIGGNVLNGTVTVIPNSGPIGFSEPTLGDISTPGELERVDLLRPCRTVLYNSR